MCIAEAIKGLTKAEWFQSWSCFESWGEFYDNPDNINVLLSIETTLNSGKTWKVSKLGGEQFLISILSFRRNLRASIMRHFPSWAELKMIYFLVDVLELYNVYLADCLHRTRLSSLERASIIGIMKKKMMLTSKLRALATTLLYIPLRAEMLIYYWGKRVFVSFCGRHAQKLVIIKFWKCVLSVFYWFFLLDK